VERIVVNCVLPRLFSERERTELEAIPEPPAGATLSAAEAVVYAAKDRAAREHIQAESIQRLTRALPLEPSVLPLLFEDASTPSAIRELSTRV
jgi:hypothetical protein